MSPWTKWINQKPPVGTLVIVKYAFYYGLRQLRENGDLYDENEIYDDSGEDPEEWAFIPQ